MVPEQTDNGLQDLRANVLNELVGLSEYMADDQEVSYELLITLARNTGRDDLLQKAFQKIQKIEDPKQKADALIDLLDEIEIRLAPAPEEDDLAEEQQPVSDEQPHENFDQPQDIPEQG